jgi:hypothetical protein
MHIEYAPVDSHPITFHTDKDGVQLDHPRGHLQGTQLGEDR